MILSNNILEKPFNETLLNFVFTFVAYEHGFSIIVLAESQTINIFVPPNRCPVLYWAITVDFTSKFPHMGQVWVKILWWGEKGQRKILEISRFQGFL